jgi:hypothetical protein
LGPKEGVPSFFLGIALLFFLPNEPETAYFLNDNDKALLDARRAVQYGQSTSSRMFHKRDMMKAFRDPKCYLYGVVLFGMSLMVYGYSNFLPTIIQGLGQWTVPQVQLLTIPCYCMSRTHFYIFIATDKSPLQSQALYPISQ